MVSEDVVHAPLAVLEVKALLAGVQLLRRLRLEQLDRWRKVINRERLPRFSFNQVLVSNTQLDLRFRGGEMSSKKPEVQQRSKVGSRVNSNDPERTRSRGHGVDSENLENSYLC